MDYKKIHDKEYYVGPNHVTLIDHNIIYVLTQGEQTYEMALAYREVCHLLHEQINGKVNYMIDLNACGKNAPRARDIWKELGAEDKTRKAATFGMNPVAQVIASFVIGTYKSTNMRFFRTRDEALSWIYE